MREQSPSADVGRQHPPIERVRRSPGTVLLMRPTGVWGTPDHWNPEDRRHDVEGLRVRVLGSSDKALREALAACGKKPRDVYGLAVPGGSRTWDLAFPRNLPWKDLPVVGDAGYAWHGDVIGKLGRGGSLAFRQTYRSRRRRDGVPSDFDPARWAELVVIDSPTFCDRVLWDCIAPLVGAIQDRALPVAWFDGREMRPVSPGTIEACRARMRVRDRLEWSFVLNATIMGSRVVHEISIEENHTKRHFAHVMPKLGDFFWEAWSMFAFQVLFSLSRIDVVAEREGRLGNGDWEAWSRKLVDGLPFVSAADGRRTMTWAGTGRYAPLKTDVRSRGDEAIESDSSEGDRLGRLVTAMSLRNWISFDDGGRVGITEAGRRLLDGMGPALDDPDLPLRWRGLDEDAIPAVDRWLNKTFRKLKRRVASKPASPFVEMEAAHAAPKGEDLAYVVYGGVVDLDGDGVGEDMRRTLAEMCTTEVAKPLLERRWGYVEGWPTLGKSPAPRAMWFGVPAYFMQPAGIREMLAGCYADLALLDAAVAAVAAGLPDPVRAVARRDQGLFVEAMVLEGTTVSRRFLPEPRLGVAERKAGDVVMVGWVEQLPSLVDAGRYKAAWTGRGRIEYDFDWYDAEAMGVKSGRRFDANSGEIWSGLEVGIASDEGFVPATTNIMRLRRFLLSRLPNIGRDHDGARFGTYRRVGARIEPYEVPDGEMRSMIETIARRFDHSVGDGRTTLTRGALLRIMEG